MWKWPDNNPTNQVEHRSLFLSVFREQIVVDASPLPIGLWMQSALAATCRAQGG
jgi:hypothetical protein